MSGKVLPDRTIQRLIPWLLMAALGPGAILAEDEGVNTHGPNSGAGLTLGISKPFGSPLFSEQNLFGIHLRMTGFRHQSGRLPELWSELELGMALMVPAWGNGYSLSFPVFMNATYDLLKTRRGRMGVGVYGGAGLHVHQVNSGIEGVEVAHQLRPSLQIGLNAGAAITARWAISIRSGYVRSFTSKARAEFAGMTIGSRDRYGYGALLFLVGLSKRF